MFEKCYCGSGLLYGKCCKPYITGKRNAPTPEALMRSRYSAYVVHEIDYIIDTFLEKEDRQINRKSTADWSENSKWLWMEILRASLVNDESTQGTVEFKAVYERRQLKHTHHEISSFIKKDGRWYYDDGKIIGEPVIRTGEKIGRNEGCPCGSGKKYKNCCGR